jgi:serine protease
MRHVIAWCGCVLLAACGGGGSDADNSGPPPIVNFSAVPDTVFTGGTTTLTWSSSVGTTSCNASGGWSGARAASGSEISQQIVATTQFHLRCINQHGNTTVSALVNVTPPMLTFSAAPAVVERNQPITLTWNAVGYEYCQAGWGGGSSERPLSGSEQFFPSAANDGLLHWQFVFQCTAPGVSTVRFANVKVRALTGKLLFPGSISMDNDINDPGSAYLSNDNFDDAAHWSFLHVRPGYVNQPQAGPAGRSFASGDLADFHYTDGMEDGTFYIRLTMPGIDLGQQVGQRADADLYVYHSNGELMDASVGSGQQEVVELPGGDSFIVEVRSVTGSVTYLLEMVFPPQVASLHAARLSTPFVPGEAVFVVNGAGKGALTPKAAADLALRRHGLLRLGGEAGRELRVLLPPDPAAALRQITPGISFEAPRNTTMTAEQSRKLATLLYLKTLESRPDIHMAMPNRLYEAHSVPNDPLYPRQRWNYEMINLPGAWDITTGSPDVTVAVIDSGVARVHPDLEPRLRDGYDMVSDPSNSDLDGIDSDYDDQGFNSSGTYIYHGTHVAGTIGAVSNNADGVSGVTWNVGLMPVRALDGRFGTMYDILQAVRYTAGLPNDSGTVPAQPADVINLSLGSSGDCEPVEIAVFEQVRTAGVIVVASAGNSISNFPVTPASCPGVFSVAALDSTRERAGYSNFGDPVDLAAPGGDLRFDADADGTPDGILSTHASGPIFARSYDFGWLQGTSMAAPHVSGVMALMKSVKPDLAPNEVEQMLAAGALTDDLLGPGRDDLGYGVINALKAVRAAQGIFANPPRLVVNPGVMQYTGNVTAATMWLSNGGDGVLSIIEFYPSAPWITVVPSSIDANGLGIYQVHVDTSELPVNGSMSSHLEIVSTAGTQNVPVLVAGDRGFTTTLTPLYVQVFDADSGVLVRSAQAPGHPRQHDYRFDDLPPGRYIVVGGSDLNNDGNLCDPGEVCGNFPIYGLPEAFEYDDTTEGIDVPLLLTATLPQ